jgi:mono/diheme cytochrome c family protein
LRRRRRRALARAIEFADMTRATVAATLLAAAVASSAAVAEAPSEFPPGPGQSEVQAACGPCHAVTVVTSARKAEPEWASTVDAMITRGAPVADADYDVIVDYLARNFTVP